MADPLHVVHHDAQGDSLAIGSYHIGIGMAVVFDGGAFTDADHLRAFAHDLLRGAAWLDESKQEQTR